MINDKSLNLLHWNCNSLQPKIHELYHFLTTNNINIACISETYLKSEIKIDNHPMFNCFRKDRVDTKRGGGVAILVSNTLKHQLLPDLNMKLIECIGIKIYSENGKKLVFFSIYIPGGTKSCEIKDHFINDIHKITSKFRRCTYFIAGDFNAKHRSWLCSKANITGKLLYDASMNEGFTIVHPLSPTHIPDDPRRTPSTIDLIITNSNTHIETPLCTYLGSNHEAVVAEIKLCNHLATNSKNRIYLYKQTNWLHYQNVVDSQMSHISTYNIDHINNSNQINELISSFTNAINIAKNKSVPQIYHNRREFLHLTPEIQQMISDRSFLRKRYQRYRDISLKYHINGLNKEIKMRINELRNEKWRNTLLTLPKNDNNKRLWTIAKRLQKRDNFLPPFKVNNKTLITAKEKAEALAENFYQNHNNPYNNLQTDFSTEVEHRTNELLSEDNVDEWNYPDVTEIISHIKNTKNSTAPGPDGIKTLLIKKLSTAGAGILTLIICACLKLSYFPEQWKHAYVIPIKKPGKNGQIVGNYRPISLLSNIAKILEKVIAVRLQQHTEELNVLPDSQHGFRKRRSTTTQLMNVTKSMRLNLNNSITTGVLFLDIEKAFDRVWHNGLLYKMEQFNYPKSIIKLIASFLRNRTFQVQLKGTISTLKEIPYGCPQGAVLSPMLYNIYIADAPCPNKCSVSFYADDTAIFCNERRWANTEDHLNAAINDFFNYFEKWKISINTGKTGALIVTRRTKKELPSTPFIVNSKQIEWSSEAKYLGVVLDKRLTLAKHVEYVIQKAQVTIRKLYPLLCRKSKLNPTNKLLLYKSCIRPVFMYAAPLLENMAHANILKLQRLQNKTLKMLMDLPWYFKTESLHEICEMELVGDFISRLSTKHHEQQQS